MVPATCKVAEEKCRKMLFKYREGGRIVGPGCVVSVIE